MRQQLAVGSCCAVDAAGHGACITATASSSGAGARQEQAGVVLPQLQTPGMSHEPTESEKPVRKFRHNSNLWVVYNALELRQ